MTVEQSPVLELTAADVARICRGELVGDGGDRTVTGVSIDSRTIAAGDVFVAIQGERFDGHDYAESASLSGATVIVANRDHIERISEQCAPRSAVVAVSDTLAALQELAWAHRRTFDIPLVAVTGSCGKTTVKEMISAVAARQFAVARSRGNFNNEIGVPLSILSFDRHIEVAVVEMGMNSPGEIASLCTIAEPNIGVITNIGRAHLEKFGFMHALAAAKGELADYLADNNGTLVISLDDQWSRRIAERYPGPCVTFGEDPAADVRVGEVHMGETVWFTIAGDPEPIYLSMPGRHSVRNALAAVAVGRLLGITNEDIRLGLAAVELPPLRMDVVTVGRATCINDSYNANPESMAAAIDVLAQWSTPSRRIAVLGDMMELGDAADQMHRQVGTYVAGAGIDTLVAVGERARATVAGAVAGGMNPGQCYEYAENTTAVKFLARYIGEPNVILVKGSRAAKMEDIVTQLKLAAEVS